MITIIRLATVALPTVLGLYVNLASAELFINPTNNNAQGQFEVSGFYGTSTVEGESTGGRKGDIDRDYFGVAGAYGINDKLDIFGSFANILKAKAEGFPSDDSGTAFTVGVRGELPFGTDFKLHGYAQYLTIKEDYGSINFPGYREELDGKITELSGGIVASKQASPELTLYGGLELILNSDGEVTDKEYRTSGSSSTTLDTERADQLGFRLGAQYNADGGVGINLSTAFFHETGFMLAINKAF